MEGQVFVPYTGIGGGNLNMGIMTMQVEGSATQTSGGNSIMYTVSWKLPGGISNQGAGASGLAWGYILGRDNELHLQYGPFTDQMFCKYLEEYGKGNYVFDADCTLTTGSQSELAAEINGLVGDYVRRVLDLDGKPGYEEYDWTQFKYYYGSCIN